jgi:hypothetical protein
MARWKLEDWIERWQALSNEVGVVKGQVTDMQEDYDEPYPTAETIRHRQKHGYRRPVSFHGYNNLNVKK